MPREKNREERGKLVVERLSQVLDDTFKGNKNLMAFCCQTDRATLDAWLSGRRIPRDLFHLHLVTRINEEWMLGKENQRKLTPKEYWENIPWQGQTDPYRREILLQRDLVETNRERWRLLNNYGQNVNE